MPQPVASLDDTSVGDMAGIAMKFFADDRKQAAMGFGVGVSEQAVAFFTPESDIALSRLRVAIEQSGGAFLEALAAQPWRAGQVVPVKMQATEGQAFVERVFDLDLVAPLVAMQPDVQRLMDI